MTCDPGWQQEAARQQALLAVLHASPAASDAAVSALALRPTGAAAERGLAAYRANAHALAHRALAVACPTLEKMVGEVEFPGLARAFWRSHPPNCGDIGEWGSALPDWLSAQPSLAAWPWLADAARLDLAVHRCDRAADAGFDAASLALLGEHDPERLVMVLMPGTALVASAYPIITMHAAHQTLVLADEATDGAVDPFAAVRAALTAGCAQRVLVWRRGWRASVEALDEASAAWTADLLAGTDLATALAGRADAAIGGDPGADAAAIGAPAFDFAGWLQRALAGGWLKGVALRGD